MPSWAKRTLHLINKYNRRFNSNYTFTTKWRAVYTFVGTVAKQLATIAAAIETVLKFRDTKEA